MKRVRFPLLLTLAVLAVPTLALAEGDVDAGKAKAVACQACHGTDGNAGIDPQYPRLAGQYADYVARALREYKNGERRNPIMAGFAAPLSEQDIDNLAAYFSSLPGKLTDLDGHLQGD
ncbi:MAG TPA: cytochrome c [Rhodanobacteraceae bacterium]|nr:cytochrome c [Rhodanobacteraceae bacterium]